MARINVTHTIGGLRRDLNAIERSVKPDMAKIVKRSTREGNALARSFARGSSGIHGKHYYKRITAEVISPLEGEYGPHGVVEDNAVGGGWRNGPPNTDLPKSADIIGPRFGDAVQDQAGKWFWP